MNDDMKLKMIENQKEIEKRRNELRKVIFDDDQGPLKNKKPKKIKKPIFTYFLLSIMLVAGIFFSVFLILDSSKRVDELYEIINAVLILLIVFSIVISFPKTLFKKKTWSTAFTSFLIIGTMVFNGLYLFDIIKLPTQSHIIDYSGKSLTKAIEWSDKNKIDYEESFEYSDKIDKFSIISQSVKPNTLTKDIKNIEFTVSNGPDYNKTVMLSDMTGLTTDDVIKFTQENYMKNVQIVFEDNKEIKNDEIIKQSSTGKIKRNDSIIFTASLGDSEKLTSIKLKDLKNEKLLNATTYLGKNGIIFELKYEFDSKIARGSIISTDVKKGATVNPGDKIILTVSKGKEVKVPDFKGMNLKDVMSFIIKNNLDIEYFDNYDDIVKKGNVISCNYKKGDIIEEETVLNIVFSKGKLVMKKFDDLASFKAWAETYQVKYEIKEEFNKDIQKGSIIKFSVKQGEKINSEVGIIVYVSKGESVKVPDFIGKGKNDIQKECDSLGIVCSFYNTLSDKEEGTAISQSIPKDTEISKGDGLDLEIATKKQEQVTTKKKSTTSTPSNNSINTNTQNNTNNQQNNNSTPSQTTTVDTCDKSNTINVVVQSSLNGTSVAATENNYRSSYPNVKFSFVTKPYQNGRTGMVHPDTPRTFTANYCDTYTIYIIKND